MISTLAKSTRNLDLTLKTVKLTAKYIKDANTTLNQTKIGSMALLVVLLKHRKYCQTVKLRAMASSAT